MLTSASRSSFKIQGSNATGDCCSKCWAQIQPKEEPQKEKTAVELSTNENVSNELDLTVKSETAVKEASTETAKPASEEIESTANEPTDEVPAKKKKKKKSYKSMMANMLEGSTARDVEKEKEKMRDEMGGGHFKKIDRI